jgi:hypothetical protein
MPISVVCSHCQMPYHLADQLAGKKVKCQKCQGAIDVPAADAVIELPPTAIKKPAPQAKNENAVTSAKPKPKKKSAAKEAPVEDASPFALPTKKGGCSCLMIAIFLFLGFGLLGCGGAAGVVWWFYDPWQRQLAELKDGGFIADDKKKADKVDPDKDKKNKKKDDADKDKATEVKKDDPKKDPPVDPKKDDAKKDKDPGKEKINPPPPGIVTLTLGPDGVSRTDGVLSDDDPPNPFSGRPHRAYQVQMEAGKSYQIDLVSDDFDSHLFLLDAKSNKITEDDNSGGGLNARIVYQAKTSDPFRIHVTHFDKKSGKFTLTVRRMETVVVQPKNTDRAVIFDANGVFSATDSLGPGDLRTIEKMPYKAYIAEFEAGVTYEIEMQADGASTPALLVLDDAKKIVAETQRRQASKTAHLLYRPTGKGAFQIQACSLTGKGRYMLKVRRCDNVLIGDDFRVGFNVISFADKLDPNQAQVAPGLIWAADGKSFYALRDAGILMRIDSANGATLQEFNFNKRCHNLAMSAEGLLISVASEPGTPEELWIVDAADLKSVKKKVPVPEMLHVAAGADASVAVATIRNQGLFVLDLKKGAVTGGFKGTSFSRVRTTRDGKTVLACSNSQPVHRFRVANGKLFLDDATAKPIEVSWGVHLSSDEQLAWEEGGNAADEVPVYPRGNLKQPAMTLKLGEKNAGINAIDPISGWIFGRGTNDHLVVYAPGGARRAKLNIPLFDPIGRSGDMSVAPGGGELLIRGHFTIAQVKIHTKGQAFAKLDPKKDPDPNKDPVVVKKDPLKKASDIEAKDVTHRVITYKAAEAPLRSPVWAADGKSFYVLCKNGAVQRINADSGEVEKSFNVGRGLTDDARLGISAEGLVVSYPGQILVIDLDLAGVKKPKFNINDISNIAVGRDSSLGVIAVRGSLHVLDLDKSKPIGATPLKLPTINMKQSADGKYLVLADNNGRILRYRIEGANLTFEENSPSVVAPPGVLNLSSDGKFVCLAGAVAAQTPANHPERGLYIYAIDDLKKPAVVLTKIDSGRAVGVDVAGGWIYANEAKKPLVIFSATGVRKGEFPLPVESNAITENVISPLGRAFLIRTPTSIVHVKIDAMGGT